MRNPLANCTVDELEQIWDAVSAYSENREEDEHGDKIPNAPLENVEMKLTTFFCDLAEFEESKAR